MELMLTAIVGIVVLAQAKPLSHSPLLLSCTDRAWIIADHPPFITKTKGVLSVLKTPNGRTLIRSDPNYSWNAKSANANPISEDQFFKYLGKAGQFLDDVRFVPSAQLTRVALIDKNIIKVVDVKSGKKSIVVKIPRLQDATFSWSMDGKLLAISAEDDTYVGEDGMDGDYELYIYNVATHRTRKLGAGYSPRWSPDGSLYAIEGGAHMGRSVVKFAKPAASSARKRLMSRGSFVALAASPDGKRLATVGYRNADHNIDEHVQLWSANGKFLGNVCTTHDLGGGLSYPMQLYWLP